MSLGYQKYTRTLTRVLENYSGDGQLQSSFQVFPSDPNSRIFGKNPQPPRQSNDKQSSSPCLPRGAPLKFKEEDFGSLFGTYNLKMHPTKQRNRKHTLTPAEKEVYKKVRKAGACENCRRKKKKVKEQDTDQMLDGS